MSHQATCWAWSTARRLNAAGTESLDPGALLVLLALSDVADENHITYPSQATISAWTGQGERTVRRHMAALEASGLLIKLSERRRRDSGLFAQDAWCLNVDGAATPPTADQVDKTIKDKAVLSKAKRKRLARPPAAKMAAGDAASPAAKMATTSGQNGQPYIDEPVSGYTVRGEGVCAPDGAPSPDGSVAALWHRFVTAERGVNPDRARAWFDPITIAVAGDGEGLCAPTAFHREWVRNHFSGHIRLAGIDIDAIPFGLAPK